MQCQGLALKSRAICDIMTKTAAPLNQEDRGENSNLPMVIDLCQKACGAFLIDKEEQKSMKAILINYFISDCSNLNKLINEYNMSPMKILRYIYKNSALKHMKEHCWTSFLSDWGWTAYSMT